MVQMPRLLKIEFVSDRSLISAVYGWTMVYGRSYIGLYLNETGDFDILFEKTTFFVITR